MKGIAALTLGLGLAVWSLRCGAAWGQEQAPGQPVAPTPVAAQPATTALVLRARNPVADAIILPFQYNANFGVGPNKVTRNVLNIQPIFPFTLNADWNLIARPVVRVIWQAAPAPRIGSAAGLGDTVTQFFFSPKRPGKWIWGLGPSLLLPTATERSLGSGKWGGGPAAIAVTVEGPWVYGVLANQVWSSGHNDRPDVSLFLLEPGVTYAIPKSKGWYLTTNPLVTANWEAPGGSVWTVPIGGGVGHLFPARGGRPATDVNLQAYYNLERPRGGPTRQLRFVVGFIFAKGR